MQAVRRHVGCVIWRSHGGGVRPKRHREQPHAALGPVARSRAIFNKASLSRVAVDEGALIGIAVNKVAWETA